MNGRQRGSDEGEPTLVLHRWRRSSFFLDTLVQSHYDERDLKSRRLLGSV
ncbi:MAG TPA: hypothetical protein VGC89_04305 [Pyrinomonadaceae bacterium]|jgi:hypothetical protein